MRVQQESTTGDRFEWNLKVFHFHLVDGFHPCTIVVSSSSFSGQLVCLICSLLSSLCSPDCLPGCHLVSVISWPAYRPPECHCQSPVIGCCPTRATSEKGADGWAETMSRDNLTQSSHCHGSNWLPVYIHNSLLSISTTKLKCHSSVAIIIRTFSQSTFLSLGTWKLLYKQDKIRPRPRLIIHNHPDFPVFLWSLHWIYWARLFVVTVTQSAHCS